MATFALVHGAWHGAWCWDPVVAELEARGHRAVAVDLPCEDTAAGAREYAAIVVDAIADAGEDVVVVGHSLGGITIPLVAQARPVRALVYLTPSIPVPGTSVVESMAADPINTVEVLANVEVVDGSLLRLSPEQGHTLLFNHCAPEVARDAVARLRPQALTPLTETTPIERLPDLPSTVILGSVDRLIDIPLMRAIAQRRLGVQPLIIESDHSPFLSAPVELAALLCAVPGADGPAAER